MADIPAIGPANDADRSPIERTCEAAPVREPLWRQMLGEQLRERRNDLGDTLNDVATRAGVSPQYLSEIERGRKEPSSEIISAVSGALDTTLLDLTRDVARSLAAISPPAAQLCASQASFALAA
ncbi:helix-turn-helix domain-containing protein [Microbacterium sp. NPDC078428]|uniref:helix-turn-helix domain-containing protein n=1 Tax=Microbacterium sp. NPDC078428 TaxID=3364190 RepID=UPI0037C99D60